ncbi:unnamed protein product [Paramecium sonneborni]|uniref:Uncharacterized protein n=1 Tax=Paramecium sonneborni TaxID=65129 RepID=A0A8S1K776_9CILI|nr:unnamed protein product [Paramecium sonneborni]
MLKQQDQQQDGFVSFMLEKEDSFILNPSDNLLQHTNEDDYYKQLSRQFYGQKNEEVKKAPKIDPSVLKYKIISRTFKTNTERQKPAISVPTVSEQLQQVQVYCNYLFSYYSRSRNSYRQVNLNSKLLYNPLKEQVYILHKKQIKQKICIYQNSQQNLTFLSQLKKIIFMNLELIDQEQKNRLINFTKQHKIHIEVH